MTNYDRLTNQEWSENIDLKKELGYSHIYKRLYELEDKIENGQLVLIDEPFYSEKRQCWGVYQKRGDVVETLFMTEEQAKTYKECKSAST
mgnify:CR=1 FL=1